MKVSELIDRLRELPPGDEVGILEPDPFGYGGCSCCGYNSRYFEKAIYVGAHGAGEWVIET